tara:strand:+ start:3307 stop:3972 length:666 start_codon:yes stop_codon:yes gene_type:complete
MDHQDKSNFKPDYDVEFKKAFENKGYVYLKINTSENFRNKNYASTYGELTQEGFYKIMQKTKELLNIKSDCILKDLNYTDLGSGLGKTPIMAFNIGAKESFGIEFAEERHLKSVEMYANLKLKIKSTDIERFNNIKYVNGDIFNNSDLDTFLKKTNVAYCSNLCFKPEICDKLGKKLILLPKNALFFSSQAVNATYLKQVTIIQVKQSWGDNQQIYVYQRI